MEPVFEYLYDAVQQQQQQHTHTHNVYGIFVSRLFH